MAVIAAVAAIAAMLTYILLFKSAAVKSVAVVPFVNASGSPETEYLSDGITESVIDSLAQISHPNLKVIALSSVLRYKGRTIDPQAMGRDLAVEALVIGRVAQREPGPWGDGWRHCDRYRPILLCRSRTQSRG